MNNQLVVVELIVAILAILSVLYQIARVERVIYEAIDAVKDVSERNYQDLQKRLDLHIQSYNDKREYDLHIINSIDKKIDYRFSRVREHQKHIEGHLEKNSNFRVRSFSTTEHDFGKGNE